MSANTVPNAEALDFRDVEAFDAKTAYLLSSGPGMMSRVYRTSDGGEHWTLQFTNPDPQGFFDAIAFLDKQNGIVLGDPLNGRFVIFTTADGGASWSRQAGPAALPDEGAFAASGTCLVAKGNGRAWFATGGPGSARVFRSIDGGRSWTASVTGMRNDSKSSGVFSLAFQDELHGEAVGGDYSKPGDTTQTTAVTSDGGRTWICRPASTAMGYRSGVAFVPDMRDTLITVGTSGSDVSRDLARSWASFSKQDFNSISAAPDGSVWAAGPRGSVAKLLVKY